LIQAALEKAENIIEKDTIFYEQFFVMIFS